MRTTSAWPTPPTSSDPSTSSTEPAAGGAARARRRLGALAAAGALSLALAACGGEDSGSMGSMDHSSMGASSEASPSAGATAETSPGSSAAAEHDDQDVQFAQMMLVHHRGAIEMAQMAPERASSPQVKELAASIDAAQQPEIEQMTSWLQAWGEPVEAGSSMEGMDHSMHGSSTSGGSMPGTMSEEQMTQLNAATGADFDRVFLQMMIEHHTGAVQMAETEQRDGLNPQALELADSIVTSQSAEIARMQQMLTATG
ncbi:DUF305 domain-containing protein [Kineococcus gypseus]|uniref:DUF305 domain-containing protein n=1 Tax=Kineococcus gypseus TaxID=1637102 RepID=UPI003D7CAD95